MNMSRAYFNVGRYRTKSHRLLMLATDDDGYLQIHEGPNRWGWVRAHGVHTFQVWVDPRDARRNSNRGWVDVESFKGHAWGVDV